MDSLTVIVENVSVSVDRTCLGMLQTRLIHIPRHLSTEISELSTRLSADCSLLVQAWVKIKTTRWVVHPRGKLVLTIVTVVEAGTASGACVFIGTGGLRTSTGGFAVCPAAVSHRHFAGSR